MSAFDPRIILARAGVAASSLEGILRAERFAEATPMQLVRPVAAIRSAPDPTAEQIDQLLFGELFDRVETADGHVWGQARRDGCVGFVEAAALSSEIRAPTHWIAALRAFAFETPAVKAPGRGPLSLNALVSIDADADRFAHAAGLGWIAKTHLAPMGTCLADPADVAERFVATPYLWGGRDSLGLDCSGLVQQALYAGGRACPRDSDQQAGLGARAPPGIPRRGDLVFWPGHVGMMLDAERLLHANAHHMAVAVEPLAEAVARIRAAGAGEPTAHRRLGI
ncbi:MAG: C40 family peptidase [Pseudomonadota bacterium]|nr:C40 family peptidase [Pseudomonadota bacterium]